MHFHLVAFEKYVVAFAEANSWPIIDCHHNNGNNTLLNNFGKTQLII